MNVILVLISQKFVGPLTSACIIVFKCFSCMVIAILNLCINDTKVHGLKNNLSLQCTVANLTLPLKEFHVELSVY